MPGFPQIQFSHQEVVTLMLSERGIREGHWEICIEFNLGVTSMTLAGGPPMPAAFARVVSVGIMRVPAPTAVSVNAAQLDQSAEFPCWLGTKEGSA